MLENFELIIPPEVIGGHNVYQKSQWGGGGGDVEAGGGGGGWGHCRDGCFGAYGGVWYSTRCKANEMTGSLFDVWVIDQKNHLTYQQTKLLNFEIICPKSFDNKHRKQKLHVI